MEHKFSKIINNLSQAIVILNRHAEIIYATDNIKTILGYHEKELIGKSSFDLLFLNNIKKVKVQYEKIIVGNSPAVNSVLRMKHKDGQIIWTELSATNMLRDKDIQGILITVKNITDKQKAEEQKLAKVITEVQEKERHTIARELHDNINQLIAVSRLLIDIAMKDNEQRECLLNASSQNLKEALDEIRKLSSSLTSYDLLDSGLNRSVKNLIEKILLGKEISIVLKMNERIESLITAEYQLHLYRIIQEQLNNIIKHATATKVLISLSVSGNGLRLKIKDNGIGFDVSETRRGIGISNIIQRVKAMNGQFHIWSEKGAGTSIIIRCQL